MHFHRVGSIGFLATSNRVNVMLSRAKHGMYILGSEATLTAKKRTTPNHDEQGEADMSHCWHALLPHICMTSSQLEHCSV